MKATASTLLLAAALAFWPTAARAGAPPIFPGEAPLELEEAEVSPRSTSVAFLMGFFPGMLVHGAGHFYAHDPEMGATLLGTEGAALVVFGIGWSSWRYGTKYAPYQSSNQKAAKGGANAMLIGGAIFAASWIADFAHAPIAAIEFNNRHKLPVRAGIGTLDGAPALYASMRF